MDQRVVFANHRLQRVPAAEPFEVRLTAKRKEGAHPRTMTSAEAGRQEEGAASGCALDVSSQAAIQRQWPVLQK